MLHRVREKRGILAQPLVKARKRVMAEESLVLRQHVALPGIKQEHEPQDDGEKSAIDLVGMLTERRVEKPSSRGIVSRLESAQQLVERMEHLLGQTFADLVLKLAAVFEQRRQPLRPGQAEQAGLPKQKAKSR